MHDTRAQTELRLRRFTAERIEPAVYRCRVPLSVTAWQAPGEPVPFTEAVRYFADAASYQPLATGDAVGSTVGNHLAAAHRHGADGLGHRGRRPPGADPAGGADRPRLPRRLARVSGRGSGLRPERPDDQGHRAAERRVGLSGGPGERVELFVEAASNPKIEGTGVLRYSPTPLGDRATAGSAPLYRLGAIELALLDVTVWELLRDIEMLAGLMTELPTDLPRRALILRALERMMDAMDPRRHRRHRGGRPGRAGRGAGLARLRQRASPARRRSRAHRLGLVVAGPGDDPQMRPNLLHRARSDGRARSTSSSPAPPRSSSPGSSSSTRNCSPGSGRRWLRDSSSRSAGCGWSRTPTCRAGRRWPGSSWPASASSSRSSVSTAKRSGCPIRSAIRRRCRRSWRPPGLAISSPRRSPGTRPTGCRITRSGGRASTAPGSSPISRRSTPTTPHLLPAELAHAERNYSEHGRGSMSLVPFGFGDGGGGPTREMIARGRRARSMEGSPTVEFSTPRAFFEQAQADYPDAPIWAGEMYLELHRGTYTSQSRTKHGNRRSEHLLREAELWAATAGGVDRAPTIPTTRLEKHWQTVLLQQFHDILPGSSIAWVYRDAERNYAELAADLEDLIGQVAGRVGRSRGPGDHLQRDPARAGRGARARRRLGPDPDGRRCPADRGRRPADAGQRAAAGGAWTVGGCSPPSSTWPTGREVIPPGGAANLLQLHRDAPNEWDAWDIDEHYRRHGIDLDVAESISVDQQQFRPRDGTGGQVAGSIDLPAGDHPGPRRRQHRASSPPSTGTSGRSCSSSPSRSTSRRTSRRRKPSSGTCSGRPTRTPPGRRRSSRSARTGGSTSANRVSELR